MFTFKSVVHFELIFPKDLRNRSKFSLFLFLAYGCSIVLALFVEESIFPPLITIAKY